jgi:hypothetical protein
MAPNHESFSMGTKRSTYPIAHPFCARPNGFCGPVAATRLIEPAVEAGILPLNYSRLLSNQLFS